VAAIDRTERSELMNTAKKIKILVNKEHALTRGGLGLDSVFLYIKKFRYARIHET